MNNILYRGRYDELSAHVASGLNVKKAFSDYPPEDLVNCDTFLAVDQILIKWIVARLVAEDIGAKLDDLTIPQICEKRSKMHFGEKTNVCYQMLSSAYQIIQVGNYRCPDNFKVILRKYQEEDFQIDYEYRCFYSAYDQMDDPADFEPLRDLVENIYTNEYLETLLPKWNAAIQEPDALMALPLQRDFYARNLKNVKERTVVIISDAMRYEVGKELFRRIQDDPKCTAKLEVQLGVLPSYTRLGMAALLPHTELTMTDDFKVLVDGFPCENLAEREAILQKYSSDSACVQFDSIKSLKIADLRSIFTGKQVVYVYHNQIDARGDKPNTEDEVFVACQEAITEIIDLIRRISTSANTYRFKVAQEQQRLEDVTAQIAQTEQALDTAQAAVEKKQKELQSLQRQTKEQRTAALTVQEIRSMGKKTITGNITLTPSECSTLKDYAVNGILAKAENSRLEDSLQQAQKSAAVWKQRYEKIYDKYQELKKEVQPYLDAVKLVPEKVRAFLDAILPRTRQTRQHDQPSRRKSQDMEL